MNVRQWWLCLALASLVTSIAACRTGPAGPQGPGIASSAQSTPDPTASPGTQPTAGDDLGQPARVSDRAVSIATSEPSYPPGATISVVILNGLDRTIFTDDSKTDCSIVILQQLRGTTWEDVAGCAQQRPPATVAIGPAHSRTASINPASSNLRINPGPAPAAGAGTYRAKYTYRFTHEQDDHDPMTALSAPFTIS